MKKTLQILNGVAFVSTIVINYLPITGVFNKSIGDVSDNLKSLFTPAGYAFSIWGLIYLLLLGFVVYQGIGFFKKKWDNDLAVKVGWWFVVSCVANSLWVFCWLYGYTLLSCICIFTLLFSVLKIILNNRIALWDAPFSTILFLWWPFVIYSGWVTVASIANVSSYLVKIEWQGFGISETIWAIIMILIATLVNLVVTWKRNMREFALVGAWALIAIAVANYGNNDTVYYTSLIAGVFLFASSTLHAYINRKTNPISKLMEELNHA